jgi:hypothetical protein
MNRQEFLEDIAHNHFCSIEDLEYVAPRAPRGVILAAARCFDIGLSRAAVKMIFVDTYVEIPKEWD